MNSETSRYKHVHVHIIKILITNHVDPLASVSNLLYLGQDVNVLLCLPTAEAVHGVFRLQTAPETLVKSLKMQCQYTLPYSTYYKFEVRNNRAPPTKIKKVMHTIPRTGLRRGPRYVQTSYENLENFQQVKKKKNQSIKLLCEGADTQTSIKRDSNPLHSVPHTRAPTTTPPLLSLLPIIIFHLS